MAVHCMLQVVVAHDIRRRNKLAAKQAAAAAQAQADRASPAPSTLKHEAGFKEEQGLKKEEQDGDVGLGVKQELDEGMHAAKQEDEESASKCG